VLRSTNGSLGKSCKLSAGLVILLSHDDRVKGDNITLGGHQGEIGGLSLPKNKLALHARRSLWPTFQGNYGNPQSKSICTASTVHLGSYTI